jgi:hypothetical protein
MKTNRTRLESLEHGNRDSGSPGSRATVEELNRMQGNAEFQQLENDFRLAACREDCDPELSHQIGLGEAPTTENCKPRKENP